MTLSPPAPAHPAANNRRHAARSRALTLLRIPASEPCEPIISLVFPIPSRFSVRDDEPVDPLCAFVAEFCGHRDPDRGSMAERKRFPVCLETEKSLRVDRAQHIVGGVIV